MADYTLRNLKHDVQDSALDFGFAPNLEARFARTELELANCGLSYQRLAPGFRMPFGHRHKQQEEVYVLVGGSARLKLDDEVVELEPWDAVRISKETMRNVEAGPDGAEMILFGAPNAGSGDVEMEPDWWRD
jgi:quercetin dioxygenase-like cupin family protein